MPYVLCYTKPGIGTYPDHNYPGHVGYLCDWEHAMYLALSDDGAHFVPLLNDTAILYPKCSYTEGDPKGVTKTLIDPWLTRAKDGTFLVCAIRRNQNAPDPQSTGCIMLFTSPDLVHFQEAGFLRLSDREIRHPHCVYEGDRERYMLEWMSEGSWYRGSSKDLKAVDAQGMAAPQMQEADSFDGKDRLPGNMLEISDREAALLRAYFGEIRHVANAPLSCSFPLGHKPTADELPKAVCIYSDGSIHAKPVDWDTAAVSSVDPSKPGVYHIPGVIHRRSWAFPMTLGYGNQRPEDVNALDLSNGMSDPCVTAYHGRFYLSSSGCQNIVLRCADTIEGTFGAAPVIIYRIPLEDAGQHGTWAAELHEIDGILYMFTSICPNGDWTRVRSVILRCNGDPLDERAWEAPVDCVKPNGKLLEEQGISLDMTYFRDHGIDYVMWSNRVIHYGTSPLLAEPADIQIATVRSDAPWQLTSDPVCIVRPMYGWDRIETEVDEAPYILRRGDDLFVTISGSSTGLGDLYDVGLLRSVTGCDLLNPAHWTWLPYPLLTKESVAGEYGPGHNNFVTDPQTGDDLMVYHAIPHDAHDRTLHRQPGMRRVHWGITGLPYLAMTAERDLSPALERVELRLTITEEASGARHEAEQHDRAGIDLNMWSKC